MKRSHTACSARNGAEEMLAAQVKLRNSIAEKRSASIEFRDSWDQKSRAQFGRTPVEKTPASAVKFTLTTSFLMMI
jgi:hypothetical protein